MITTTEEPRTVPDPVALPPITDVRISPASERFPGPVGRLHAFAAVTLADVLVIRDIRVLARDDGTYFLSLPSAPVHAPCPDCRRQAPLKAVFCPHCGRRIGPRAAPPDERGRARLYRDTCFPIRADFRMALEAAVLEAFAAWAEAGEGVASHA
jgi:DNA-binding cell septation regulator SpoVG